MVIPPRSMARRSSDSSVRRSVLRARIAVLVDVDAVRRRCAWNGTSRKLGVLDDSSVSWVCGSLSARPIEAVRKISRSLKAIGARMVLADGLAKAVMRGGILFGHQDQAELVAESRASVSCV